MFSILKINLKSVMVCWNAVCKKSKCALHWCYQKYFNNSVLDLIYFNWHYELFKEKLSSFTLHYLISYLFLFALSSSRPFLSFHTTYHWCLLQLVLTVMLLTIIVYIYTVIAFNFFRKFYIQEEDDGGDKKCHEMFSVI